MSVASTAISKASFVLSNHAKLDDLASDEPLVKETRESGHKITSASSMGGYGNAGAWGIVRCLNADQLDDLLDRHGIKEHRAAELLEDGEPLWHVVVEEMKVKGQLGGDPKKKGLTTRILLGGFNELMEGLWDLVVEPMEEDFSVEDLHMAVHQLEPLLKLFYDGAKADSKWKGQVAYHQLAQHRGLRKTLLITVCDRRDDREDLVTALLRYTREELCHPRDPRRLQIEADGRDTHLRLAERTGLPAVAVAETALRRGERYIVRVDQFGDPGHIGVGVLPPLRRGQAPFACMPGEVSQSVGIDLKTMTIVGAAGAHDDMHAAQNGVEVVVSRSGDGAEIIFEGPGIGRKSVPLPGADSEVFPAVSMWSSGAHVICEDLEDMLAVAPDKPWLVLCDVAFGRKDEALADPYGNTPFHSCAYQGNVKSLQALLHHVQQHPAANLRMAVSEPSQPNEAETAVTPLNVATKRKNSRCAEMLEQFLSSPRNFATLPLAEGEHEVASTECTRLVASDKSSQLEELFPNGLRWTGDLEERLNLWMRENQVRKCRLQLSGMRIESEDMLRQIRAVLVWSSHRCSEVVWTRSTVELQVFLEVLEEVLNLLATPRPPTWRALGLGFNPQFREGDRPADRLAHQQRFAETLQRLIATCANAPLGNAPHIRISNTWIRQLAPEDRGLLHVLGSTLDIHKHTHAGPKGKGKGHGKSANPLSSNPFIPGLCRLKNVAVGGGWQTLRYNHTFAASIDVATKKFLQELLRSWSCFMQSCSPRGELPRLCRQALDFITEMPDFEPMCTAELQELDDVLRHLQC